jgi:hypothetical protein
MASMKRNPIPVLAIWAVCLPVGAFSWGVAESGTRVPETERRSLESLFSGFVAFGAKPEEEPAFYTDNLWEYIDGAAEAFHGYDFSVLVHQIFKFDGAEVTVDVYDMGDSLNAFGIYSAERSPDYRFVSVGAQGYGDALSLNFLQGPYYAKLSVYREGPPDSTLLTKFAKALSARMGAVNGFPRLFTLFPKENAVPNSEKYTKKSPLGHAFLGSAYQESYALAGGTAVLTVSVSENAAQAVENVARLKAHFEETGEAVFLSGFEAEAYEGSNDFEGRLTFTSSGKYVILLSASDSVGMGLIRETADNLKRSGL